MDDSPPEPISKRMNKKSLFTKSSPEPTMQSIKEQRRISVNDEFGKMLQMFENVKEEKDQNQTKKKSIQSKGRSSNISKKSRKSLEQEIEMQSNHYRLDNCKNKRIVDNRGSIREKTYESRSNTLALPKSPQKLEDEQPKEMKISGKFILLTAANIFLSRDYEYCLRICSTNFSYVADTALFEGNILRFRALASEQLFSLMCANLEEKEVLDYSALFDAIDSAKNSLQIYSDAKN